MSVHWGASALVKTFVSPHTSLGDLDAASAAHLIGAASDITLVLDGAGVIRDMAFQSGQLMDDLPDSANWVGRPIEATVAPDSRAKIAALMQDAAAKAEPRWRQVNHLAPDGRSVPVLYCGVQAGGDGRVVAFGRDLRAMSALQQRLMNAQQGMERDYARLRDVEMRYRLLFQLSSEAVLVVDPAKGRVTEANPAAKALCGSGAADVTGRALADLFDPASMSAIQAAMEAARTGARAEDDGDGVMDGLDDRIAGMGAVRDGQLLGLLQTRRRRVRSESADHQQSQHSNRTQTVDIESVIR